MTTWIMDLSDTDPSSTSAKLRRTMKFWLVLLLALTICVSCDQPSASLVGKWEADTSKVRPVQIEFLADGSVIENEKVLGKWQQVGTGSFKFISPTRIKVDLQPRWAFWGHNLRSDPPRPRSSKPACGRQDDSVVPCQAVNNRRDNPT